MIPNQDTYNITVRDSIFKPGLRIKGLESVAHYRKKNKTFFYKVHLFLEGKDLPFIKKATYYLHKTFKNQVRTIERSPENFNCELVLWTWGIFTVKVELEDIKGRKIMLEHYLSYGDEIEKKGIKWVTE